MLLYIVSIVLVVAVYGQLSVDELFQFNSQHTVAGNCTHFQYSFADLRVEYHKYNQLIFDCRSSSLILRNDDDTSSSVCPDDEEYLQNFRIHFYRLPQSSIEVNQLRLPGIELSSLDDQIRNVYHEHSSYRSRWALLINLNSENSDEQVEQHVAIATNGELTFVLFLLSPTYNATSLGDQIELIYPGGQSFHFTQSGTHIWRIDQGYVRHPRELENALQYQLSKTRFALFDNETFVIYGTQFSSLRRFLVYVDETRVTCKYNYILQCTFPVLPSHVRDTHEPIFKVFYGIKEYFNKTLTLRSRTRLHRIPTNHSLTAIETFEVNIAEEICVNQSLFSFVVHLWKEDVNGTARYTKMEKSDLPPIECNATASIGHEIQKVISAISIDDILSMDVDLIHQWYDHRECRAEKTRISFI